MLTPADVVFLLDVDNTDVTIERIGALCGLGLPDFALAKASGAVHAHENHESG